MMNVTQRVETPTDRNLSSSTQNPPVRLQNTTASDKNANLQPPKKTATKVLRPSSSSDITKGRRQTNDVASDSSATRPVRDVPAAVSKQQKDFTVDIRTPSQPPTQPPPVADIAVSQPSGSRLEKPSPLSDTPQSSSHVRAEEFLQVSNLWVCCK